MSITIRPGDLVVMDPSDKRLFAFDWSDSLQEAGSQIVTSTFTIAAKRQSVGAASLTKDSESILAGSTSTQLRLMATTATLGDKYRISNTIVTNENPAETKERSFFVLVQDR